MIPEALTIGVLPNSVNLSANIIFCENIKLPSMFSSINDMIFSHILFSSSQFSFVNGSILLRFSVIVCHLEPLIINIYPIIEPIYDIKSQIASAKLAGCRLYPKNAVSRKLNANDATSIINPSLNIFIGSIFLVSFITNKFR